jgi:hypothetical protein
VAVRGRSKSLRRTSRRIARKVFTPDRDSRVTMKTNMAIALLLCGAALWLPRRGAPYRVSAVFASAGAAIGAVTLAEHLFGIDAGIDELLFTEVPGAAATTSPNRMGPHGSTSLMLAGIAMLLLRRGAPRAARLAQACSYVAIPP